MIRRMMLLAIVMATFGCDSPVDDDPPIDTCTAECGDQECGTVCDVICGTCDEGLACVEGMCSTCGNGVKEDDETCDPSAGVRCALESGCVSDNPCYSATYSGSEATCDAKCTSMAVTECVSGDACCAAGCHPGNDIDCAPPNCGNGIKESFEACDGPEFPCAATIVPPKRRVNRPRHARARCFRVTPKRARSNASECRLISVPRYRMDAVPRGAIT